MKTLNRKTFLVCVLFVLGLLIANLTFAQMQRQGPRGNHPQGQSGMNKRCGDGACEGPETTQNCPQDCAQQTSQTAATADSTINATAIIPAPPTRTQPQFSEPFSLNEGIGAIPQPAQKNYDTSRYANDVSRDAQMFLNTGASWYRLHTTQFGGLSYEELTRENFSYSLQDTLIRGLEDKNIAIVLMLGPRRGNDKTCVTSYLPADTEAFKKYLRNTVERYDGDGVNDMPGLKYGIHYWQLDNEVDLHSFGCTKQGQTSSTPQEYVGALKIFRDEVKAADPQAVIFPSFWFAGDPSNREGASYFEKFVALGGLDLVDIIDAHEYTDDLNHLVTRINNINALISKNPKPIWMMETSVPSNPLANPKWNPALQARAVIQWHVSAFAVQNFQKMFWHTLYQSPARGDQKQWQLFGSNGLYLCLKEKQDQTLGIADCGERGLSPGGLTYRLMTEKIRGFTLVQKLSDGVFKFSFPNERGIPHPVFVLWSHAGSKQVDLTQYGMTGALTLTHIIEQFNQATPQTESVQANAVPISESPVFVE